MSKVASNLVMSNHGFVGEYFGADEKHAIVLSGGGIDSFMSTIAWLMSRADFLASGIDLVFGARSSSESPFKNISLTFLVFNYKQQSFETELFMTKKQSEFFSLLGVGTVTMHVIDDNLISVIRNPLANRTKQKKDNKNYAKNDDYVPNRNARFIFNAAGLAETIAADTIIIGAVGNVNQDNSLAFLEAAYATIKQSNRDHFPTLYAPFVLMSKSMVALLAKEQELEEMLPFLTTSCFDATYVNEDDLSKAYFNSNSYVGQCGICRSCTSLKQAFKFAAVEDPYYYAEQVK